MSLEPVATRAQWRVELLLARGRQVGAAIGLRSRTTYVWQRTDEHRACWRAAAAAIGAEFVPLSNEVWEVRRGDARTRIANDKVQIDDPVVLDVAGDKELCYRLAADAGVRVPDHEVFERDDVERAWRLVRRDGHPYVAKPARGTSSGIGVTVGIRSRRRLVAAFATAGVRDRRIILERLVPGETCRLLFLDGELIHAVRRRGARVTGDGQSTIRALLARQAGPGAGDDDLARAFLAAQDLVPDDVPAAGTRVVARGMPFSERRGDEVRTVYDETITGLVSPELADEARRVVSAVGSCWAGVDVVTPDPGRPLRECGAFLEVNTTPGILHHCAPGPDACEVAMRVLQRLLGSPA